MNDRDRALLNLAQRQAAEARRQATNAKRLAAASLVWSVCVWIVHVVLGVL